jgi:fluoride exporter
MILSLSLVAFGGALGAVLRFATMQAVPFPFGTLAVNVVGSFLIGALVVALASRPWAQPFLMIGVLGGLTTFSAFSLDTLRLVEGGRAVAAGAYVLASVVLSLGACAVGIAAARGIAR